MIEFCQKMLEIVTRHLKYHGDGRLHIPETQSSVEEVVRKICGQNVFKGTVHPVDIVSKPDGFLCKTQKYRSFQFPKDNETQCADNCLVL